MFITPVDPHVLCQLIYPLREQGNLDLRGARVFLMSLEVFDDDLFFIFFHYAR